MTQPGSNCGHSPSYTCDGKSWCLRCLMVEYGLGLTHLVEYKPRHLRRVDDYDELVEQERKKLHGHLYKKEGECSETPD